MANGFCDQAFLRCHSSRVSFFRDHVTADVGKWATATSTWTFPTIPGWRLCRYYGTGLREDARHFRTLSAASLSGMLKGRAGSAVMSETGQCGSARCDNILVYPACVSRRLLLLNGQRPSHKEWWRC